MYKSKLQELCHQCSWTLPEYATVREGPDHCPRFTGTVTVRGFVFESPKNECKSAKEAQNLAAKVAFDHLYALNLTALPRSVVSPNPTSLPSPGFLFSNSKGSDLKATDVKSQEKHFQTSLSKVATLDRGNDSKSKDTLHLYKNRLQHYAQKKSLSLPAYSCEFDGPPHARRFRATVAIDGKSYRTTEYFTNLKDAEHAAAKVAFESLSEDGIQEDESLYKTLLQEWSRKEGFRFPSYSTIRTGPSHKPTFKSTVEVGGQTFSGAECKTKKLSEMNAAKIAFTELTEYKATLSVDNDTVESSEIKSVSLQPNSDTSLPSTIEAGNDLETWGRVACGETGKRHKNSGSFSPSNTENEAIEAASLRIAFASRESKVDMLSKSGLEVNGNEGDCRGPENCLPETFPLSNAVPESLSSDADTTVGGGYDAPATKILIYSRESNMTIPEGASIMPCSNDKWLAVSMMEKPVGDRNTHQGFGN